MPRNRLIVPMVTTIEGTRKRVTMKPLKAFNGFIVTRFRVPSIVVTIGTMSLYRGIAYVVLGDQVYRSYPPAFDYFGQGYVFWVISFEFALFAMLALIFGIVLHRTVFGRQIYAIGNNPVAAQFSGIRVDR